MLKRTTNLGPQLRTIATLAPEYAFEMASSTLRFGRGVTKEIGEDIRNFGFSDGVCVVTDKKLVNMQPFKTVSESLCRAGVKFDVFDDVSVEPTDASLLVAIQHCRQRQFKAFIAVGGGSVMDTAKASNAYMCNPNADFLDYVNAPIGRGLPIPLSLKPLIAVPTTAGTGK
jgi:hydroxyacid-oxoacid transhydrogenase